MKKICLFFSWVMILSLLLSLCCSASALFMIATSWNSYDEYLEKIEAEEFYHDIVEYKQLASIGSFESFRFVDGIEYWHIMRDRKGALVEFSEWVYEEPKFLGEGLTLDALSHSWDMRTLKEDYSSGFYYIDIGVCTYLYKNGNLYNIKWYGQMGYSIDMDDDSCYEMHEYPLYAGTVMSGLLRYKTAEKTLNDLKADIERGYAITTTTMTMEVVVCCVICGLLIVAVVICVILLRRRRRRGAGPAL